MSSVKKVTLVTREEWGAEVSRKELEPLTHPLEKVYITLDTYTRTCDSKEGCMQVLREIQERAQSEGQPDIPFNFLVGNDGNVYEGRGWHKKPTLANTDPQFSDKTLDIAYIGNYSDQPYPVKLYGYTCDLLIDAVNSSFMHYGAIDILDARDLELAKNKENQTEQEADIE